MYNVIDNFLDEIQSHGFEPPCSIVPGKITRFPGLNKSKNNRSGWCLLFEDHAGGCYGDWSSDFYKLWFAESDNSLTNEEKDRLMQRAKEAYEETKRQAEEIHRKAAQKADYIWNTSLPAPENHAYSNRKRIKPYGARLYKESLVLKITNILDELVSLQFISPDSDGSKTNLKGGRKSECFIHVNGDLNEAPLIVICEGWATGCTLAEDEPTALVLAAIDKNNLEAVAVLVRNRWPFSKMIIAGDDDRLKPGNPGATKANEAAIASNALVALPEWPEGAPIELTDFNDLANWKNGDNKMNEQIEIKGTLLKSPTQPNEEWPQIIPLDMLNLPSLNLDCLPSWASDFARALSDSTETPPELAAGQILAVAATAAARRLKIVVTPTYSEPCNLWIIVALPSGNRKSAVQSKIVAPLDEWERTQAKELEPKIKQLTSEHKTMQARIAERRKLASKAKDALKAKEYSREAADLELELPIIPSYPQLWISDSTPEKLGILLKENDECMAWLSSEGGLFDSLQGRHSNNIPNLDLVLKCHPGDSEKITRISREAIFLKNPLLSIGLSPQPGVLYGLASKPGFNDRGLLARFLYLLPPSPLGYRSLNGPPIPEKISRAYAAGIQAMLNWEPAFCETNEKAFHMLHLSNEANCQSLAFAHTLEKGMRVEGIFEHATDWGSKASGATIRIAGGLHGMLHAHNKPWDHEISNETMANAIELMLVFMAHSLAAFNIMGSDPNMETAKRILNWIKAKALTHFTIRELFNSLRTRNLQRTKQLEQPLAILQERGYIRIDTTIKTGAGRPTSPVVVVNPKLQEKL